MENGIFIISLDLEMMWGVHEWSTIANYGESNVKNVRQVVDRLLYLFKKYDIHATFAAVGMLMCKDKNELKKFAPDEKPTYEDDNLSPYKQGFLDSIPTISEPLFFGVDIIEKLKSAPNIEIGTHTFSHYYCWEAGQTPKQFEDDLNAAINISQTKGISVNSIIFPKNNVSSIVLKSIAKFGLKAYRGNPRKYFTKPKSKFQAIQFKICRLLDNYIPLTRTTYEFSEIEMTEGVVNVKASRFLRPYNKKLCFLEPLRLMRLKSELKDAARNKRIFHLWWHPHNFGDNIDDNFRILEDILECYRDCEKKYNMQSMSMFEIAQNVNKQD